MLSIKEVVEKANEMGMIPEALGRGLRYHTDVLLAYLDGAEIEACYDDGKWSPVVASPTFVHDRKYRVAPPKFKHWSLINSEYNWIAMQESGVWLAFTEQPDQHTNCWHRNSKDASLRALVMPEVSDWKQSLIERPVGE